MAEFFYLKFLKKEKVSRDVFAFYFSRNKSSFNFVAGQYFHLYLPVKNEKGRGNSRMFTIASSPLEKDYIFIATKKGNSFFKKKLFNLDPKTAVKFYGPSGNIVVDESGKNSYVFLSLGIGITPFRSIIKYVNQKKIKIPIILLASFSMKEDMIFFDELKQAEKENSNIKVVYTLTSPAKDWEGETGRITSELIKKYVRKINNNFYFIVGSPAGIIELEEKVLEAGVSEDKIFLEDFEGY